MPHIHWVARQNKLEIPRDKDGSNSVKFARNFWLVLAIFLEKKTEDKKNQRTIFLSLEKSFPASLKKVFR
jgi:hypothetical protein